MGAFDSFAGSMRPPSAHHLKPGVRRPTEVHTLLQVIGRLLTCGINSVHILAFDWWFEVKFAFNRSTSQSLMAAPRPPLKVLLTRSR
jgi:hypothetical protein